MVHSLSLRSSVELHRKSIEKDTQSYLTNMNQPLLLLLFSSEKYYHTTVWLLLR